MDNVTTPHPKIIRELPCHSLVWNKCATEWCSSTLPPKTYQIEKKVHILTQITRVSKRAHDPYPPKSITDFPCYSFELIKCVKGLVLIDTVAAFHTHGGERGRNLQATRSVLGGKS